MRLKNTITSLASLLLLSFCGIVSAQSWPDRPVKVIVPYAPGGGVDPVARLVSLKLADIWKQPVVVENKAGGSGTIGANFVAKAPSDGLTILKGDETAATTYLRSKTTSELKSSFNPIIKTSLDKVNATKYWEKAITAYNAIPFSNKKINPDLSAYVTEKAMEGIYSEIAKQEKDIRANPMARTTDLLKRVFEK